MKRETLFIRYFGHVNYHGQVKLFFDLNCNFFWQNFYDMMMCKCRLVKQLIDLILLQEKMIELIDQQQ